MSSQCTEKNAILLLTTNNLQFNHHLDPLQQLIDQIPVRYNLVSHIMFLGVAQAYFMAFIILLRANLNTTIRIFGWSLLFQAIVCTDTYMCYTGLMKYALHLNDSTEFIVLLIAPSIYLFTYSLLTRKPIRMKKHGIHLLVPLLYLLSQIVYFANPLVVKLNAYLDAYHDTIPMASVPEDVSFGYHWIKGEFRWLVLFSFAIYLSLSIGLVIKNRKAKKQATRFIRLDKYAFTRNTLVFLVVLLALILTVFLRYEDDSGDHFIVIAMTCITYASSFFILSESRFFEKSWIADKYETLATSTADFATIDAFIEEQRYFLGKNASLGDLAAELQTSSNQLSKTINLETGFNFNDYLNQKRIAESKKRLVDPAYGHLTIEAIGNSVGFKSKSAFYNAFKRHVGESPSVFAKTQK